MSEIFPKLRQISFLDAPAGRVVFLDTRSGVQMAVVVEKEQRKLLLCLTDEKYAVIKAPTGLDVLSIENDIRIAFDASAMTRIEGIYEPSAIGFLATLSGEAGGIICSEFDGYDQQNVMVHLADWQVGDVRLGVRIGTKAWQVEIYDDAAKTWKMLHRFHKP